MKKTLTFMLAFLILMTACESVTPTVTSTPPPDLTPAPVTPTSAPLIDIPLGAGYGVKGAWFELYFTNPESPLASQKTGGVDGPLAAAIDAAEDHPRAGPKSPQPRGREPGREALV